MKNYLLFILSLLIAFSANCQSGFDQNEFMIYRNQIKDLSYSQLKEKHALSNTYYENRQTLTNCDSFQYFDSIDIVYNISRYEKSLLSDNHFVVSERLSVSSFAQAFVNLYSNDLPLFLSTDFFLHAFHASYDVMLRNLEMVYLEPNLKLLINSFRLNIPSLMDKYKSEPLVTEALGDVDLFVAIALSLLNNKDVFPLYGNKDLYTTLMMEIYSENPGIIEIPLFSDHSRKIDMSQFTPRGHYTEEVWFNGELRTLEDYFRSMMWLGRIDFMLTAPPVAPGEDPWSDEDMQRMARGALLMNELLNDSDYKDLFEIHEKIINFFVGPDDNLNPSELEKIKNELKISVSNVSDLPVWNRMLEKFNESDEYGQKIMSNFFSVDLDKQNPAELPISYRLLGQKFLIDSYIFSQLVYDRLYFQGKEVLRMMPDLLDALFVLGNDNALPLLEDEINTYNYSSKLEELRYLTNSYDEDFWNQSLYNVWVNAIRSLNPGYSPDNLPYFMQTTEWQLEKMNTQLASWAELRHDNVLYAKQSYTGGTSCSFPYVYLEPYPGFYDKLYVFSQRAVSFFNNELVNFEIPIKESITEFYSNFGKHMLKLKEIAGKELLRENFCEDDIIYLKTFINGAMSSGPMITGWFNELFYDPWKAMEPDFCVVDVHTQPTDEAGVVVGNVLHVGTGNINLGIFCTGSPANDYLPAAFIGPVMSFHTHTESKFKRLTDDEWLRFFEYGGVPPERPAWTNHYLADENGNMKGSGKEPKLKGISFINTYRSENNFVKDIAYSVIFPNPFSESCEVRFILNNDSRINFQIFDIMGKKMNWNLTLELNAGEHNVPVNCAELAQGVYFMSMISENGEIIKRFIKK